MKSGIIQILDLDFEFKLWKNRLLFYLSEISIMNERLNILKKEHPGFIFSKDKLKLLNEQQQRSQMLINKISTMEQEMSLFAEDYPINEKHSHYSIHETIRIEMHEVTDKQREILRYIYPDLCYPNARSVKSEE